MCAVHVVKEEVLEKFEVGVGCKNDILSFEHFTQHWSIHQNRKSIRQLQIYQTLAVQLNLGKESIN